jgi:hypothetical protein
VSSFRYRVLPASLQKHFFGRERCCEVWSFKVFVSILEVCYDFNEAMGDSILAGGDSRGHGHARGS